MKKLHEYEGSLPMMGLYAKNTNEVANADYVDSQTTIS